MLGRLLHQKDESLGVVIIDPYRQPSVTFFYSTFDAFAGYCTFVNARLSRQVKVDGTITDTCVICCLFCKRGCHTRSWNCAM